MADVAEEISEIVGGIREAFARKSAAREVGLSASREALRKSANSVRATHRKEFDRARQLLDEAASLLERGREALRDEPDILYAGFVQDAEKEYAEGRITLAVIAGLPVPRAEELRVGHAPYLNGLGEAVGELRRYLLDSLRHDELDGCERILQVMDESYGALITVDYPDAMTGGLRRTTDAVRGILEKTRGDLTLAVRQRQLERKLAELQGG